MRAALTFAALTIAAGLAESCSSSSAPEPEHVEQQDSKLTSCGTPVTVHTNTDAASHVTQSVVPAGASLLIPSTVQATGAMWYTYSTISASVNFGAVTCLYSSSVPQAPLVDLAFVSCTGGLTPGSSVNSSSVEFWGTMNGFTGTAGLDVSLARSVVDPAQPCIVKTCVNNVITTTNAPAGTQCDSSNLCLGIKTCDGAGGCTVLGAPPPSDDGDSCTTDTACVAPSTLPTHTHIAGCGAPDGGAPPYPGNPTLPSDFAAGAAFLYTGGTQTGVTNTIYANRAAIVRGRVINTSGVPVSGATVKILGQTGYARPPRAPTAITISRSTPTSRSA